MQTTLDREETLTPTLSRGTGRGNVFSAAVGPLCVLIVFAVGYAWRIGWPAWPVTDAGERIAYAAIVATLPAIGAAMVRSALVRFVLNLIAAAICALPTMWPQMQNEVWTSGVFALWASAVTVGVALAASILQSVHHRDGETPLAALVTLGMAAAGGGLLMSTGSLKLGEAGFSLAAGVAISFVVGLFVKPIGRSVGVVTLAFAILGGLFVSGYLWSELPLYAAACVFVAPLLAAIVRIPILARRPVWQRVIIGVVAAAIPATAAAVPLALKAQKAAESADEYGY